jgi:hypothetical protein
VTASNAQPPNGCASSTLSSVPSVSLPSGRVQATRAPSGIPLTVSPGSTVSPGRPSPSLMPWTKAVSPPASSCASQVPSSLRSSETTVPSIPVAIASKPGTALR